MTENSLNQEIVYRLVYERQWAALLDLVYIHRSTIAKDVLLNQAVDTFVTVFFSELENGAASDHEKELEKLFLLHVGRFYVLLDRFFDQVVTALVEINKKRPQVALGYARHCPDNEVCAEVISRYGQPDQAHIAHPHDDTIEVTKSISGRQDDLTTSLFKSQQEVDFFLAVKEVFPSCLVYPNVALRCLFDYEALKNRLTGEERRYFFTGLVDCVVFEEKDGYRPLHFFELDSIMHDDETQRTRDRHKERILSQAGKNLYRIRKRGRDINQPSYVQLIRELVLSSG